MNHTTLFNRFAFLDLRLFDGEGGDASGASGAETAPNTADAPQTANADAAQANGKENAFHNFDEAMNDPTFKAEFEKKFQTELARRTKTHRTAQAELQRARGDLATIRSMFGVPEDESIVDALKKNSGVIAELASENNMSTESYIEFQRMKGDLEAARAADRDRQIAEYNEILSRELSAVKAKYPEFDPDAAMNDPDFVGIIKNGVPAEVAYYALHHDELMNRAVTEGVQAGKQMGADAARTRRGRPAENAAGGSPAQGVRGIDISKLTTKEMDALDRRAANGERITLT